MTQGKKETQESFGMLQFSRTTRGKDTALFGSSIPHRETIRLRVMPASVERDLNNDFYYSSDARAYVEVEMSQAQFAEAITSMNQGSGVPVTIRRLNGKEVEEVDFVNKRRQFELEFKEQMQELGNRLGALIEEAEDVLKNKKSIAKGDRETILKGIYSLTSNIKSSIPFISSQFNEQLDKTVHESKSEFEATVHNYIHRLGIEKLEDLQALMKLSDDTKNQKQLDKK